MTFQPSRRQFVFGTTALLAGTVVGCSTGNGTRSSPSTAQPSLIVPSGTAAPELQPNPTAADLVGGPQWTPADLSGVTLTLWGLNYAPHIERYKLLAKRFEAATGATVKLQPQDDMVKQSLTSLSGGNPPDVLCIMGIMSDQLVKQGGLLSLTDVVYQDLKIDMQKWWVAEALQAYTFGDKQYGVPLESNAHAGVGCRLDLIEAAGSKVDGLWPGAEPESAWPSKGVHFESFDQMFKLAEALTQKGGDKVKIWGQNRQGWELDQLATNMFQQGTMWWDESSGQFNLDNDACVEALEWMVPKPYALGIESNLAVGSSVNAFVAGQTALAIGNDSSAGEGTKAGFKATNVVQPSMVPGEVPKFMGEGGWGFEVPVKAKNQAAGIEFARFATTYEAQFTYSQIYDCGSAPACAALVNSKLYQGDTPLKVGQRRLLTALDTTQFRGHGFDPQTDQLVSTIVNTLREGKISSKETASQLQKQLTAQQQRFART